MLAVIGLLELLVGERRLSPPCGTGAGRHGTARVSAASSVRFERVSKKFGGVVAVK